MSVQPFLGADAARGGVSNSPASMPECQNDPGSRAARRLPSNEHGIAEELARVPPRRSRRRAGRVAPANGEPCDLRLSSPYTGTKCRRCLGVEALTSFARERSPVAPFFFFVLFFRPNASPRRVSARPQRMRLDRASRAARGAGRHQTATGTEKGRTVPLARRKIAIRPRTRRLGPRRRAVRVAVAAARRARTVRRAARAARTGGGRADPRRI